VINREAILGLAHFAGCVERTATVHPGPKDRFAPHETKVFIFTADELERFARSVIQADQPKPLY